MLHFDEKKNKSRMFVTEDLHRTQIQKQMQRSSSLTSDHDVSRLAGCRGSAADRLATCP